MLEEDNAYRTSTPYFFGQKPETRKKAEESEYQETLAQFPVLEEVVKHLDDQIAYLSSVDSIDADLGKSPAQHQKELAANKLAKKKLEVERTYILARIDKAVKR